MDMVFLLQLSYGYGFCNYGYGIFELYLALHGFARKNVFFPEVLYEKEKIEIGDTYHCICTINML